MELLIESKKLKVRDIGLKLDLVLLLFAIHSMKQAQISISNLILMLIRLNSNTKLYFRLNLKARMRS